MEACSVFVLEIDVLRYVTIPFILLLSSAESWSVQPYTPVHPDPVLESWRWRDFPELKGLGLNCIAEDRDGVLWFGVRDGVRRYDGLTWTAYTPDGLGLSISSLCATRDGSVYAGNELGISRFRNGVWSHVFPPQEELPLPWPITDLMEASDGSLWAATVVGALHLNAERTTLYTTEDMGAMVRVLAPDLRLSIVPVEMTPSHPGFMFYSGSNRGTGILVVRLKGSPLVIWGLVPGSPGETAGLKVGDRIYSIEGKPPVVEALFSRVDESVRLAWARRKGHTEIEELLREGQ